jgi:hypothetical protein
MGQRKRNTSQLASTLERAMNIIRRQLAASDVRTPRLREKQPALVM